MIKLKKSLGEYESVSYANGIGKISGQFPFSKENILITGKLGKEVSLEEAGLAAKSVALNIIAHLNAINEKLDALELVHIDCYVQSIYNDKRLISTVDETSLVLKGALGKVGGHSRSLMIVNDLPFNAMMEIVTTFSYKNKE